MNVNKFPMLIFKITLLKQRQSYHIIMKTNLQLLLVILFATSCNQNDPIVENPKDEPIALRVGMEKRVSQDNEFAFDLLKKTIDLSKETNVFVSPLSVSIALGMAWNGANGETRTEMETAMKMSGLSVADINDYYQIMQSSLPGVDHSTKLSIANSLWYRSGFPVKTDFLKVNNDYFGAYVRELDFAKAWAVDTVNNWCSKKTNKLIPTIIDDIPDEAMMYLINAVYFKGIWANKFDKKITAESAFTNELKNQVTVNMMYQKDTFGYYTDTYAQYLDMPYGNKSFSMTVILPTVSKTTLDVLENLNLANWNAMLGSLQQREVMVSLPRFKVENKFILNQVLQNMGMKLAFSDFADFSKISDIKLVISEVIHKTYITVDEEGTEAAAVTSIGFETTSMPNYPIFTVNRPFIFVIREKSTGVILFIGKIGNVEKY